MGHYGNYQTDILEAWQFPVIGDISQPETARFLDALDRANQADRPSPPSRDSAVQSFTAAVAVAAQAWEQLERVARHVGTRRIPEQYAEPVNQAIKLLQKGLNAASTDAERYLFVQRAIQQAQSAIDHGYLSVPPKNILALQPAHTRSNNSGRPDTC
jgi:hypothetical protein